MNDFVKELNETNAEQGKACNQNCRYSICSIIATCWVLLFPKDSTSQLAESSTFLPLLVLILAVIYFLIETISYYSVTNLARRLQKEVIDEEIDEKRAACLMTAKSNKTFALLKFKIVYCIILVVLLGHHIITMLV